MLKTEIMKNFLIIFCTAVLIIMFTIVAFNSGKGAARQRDGIMEPGIAQKDSLLRRGELLLKQMNYSDNDKKAIAAYLKNMN